MLLCDQKDHENEEILTVCLNMKCQLKRACCHYCIINHQSHQKDQKTLSKLQSWKKELCQMYYAFREKLDKILNMINSTETYLSNLSVDPEISFYELHVAEFEDYISKLLKIQQISQPFNTLLSDLLPQLEPLTKLIQLDDKFTLSTSFDEGSIISESKSDKQIITTQQLLQSQQQQQLKIQTDEQSQYEEKKIRMRKYIYQELLEKTLKIRKENELDIHQYPTIHLKSLENLDQFKTILLIGTSKSGKQQLINLFLNYYYGVDFYDPYRFEMIDDIDILKDKQNLEYDQTKVYYITPQNGNPGLRIIYTPDYSEELIYEDQNREQKIHNLLNHTISLNQCILIGFVISSDIKISQYYMLESILSKFSNNIINNIVFLFPDCTLDNPKQKEILLSTTPLIDGIQSPIVKMIPTITNSWYLKFNTSMLFVQNNQTNKLENKQLWEMGKKSFQELIQKQLQYKLNLQNSDQMRKYYNSKFLRAFSDFGNYSQLREKCVNQFKSLYQNEYKSETIIYRELKEKAEQAEQLNTEIKNNITNNTLYYNNKYLNKLKNADHLQTQYSKLKDEIQKKVDEQDKLISNYCYRLNNKTQQDKEFQEFYDSLKQFTSEIQEYLIKIISDHAFHFYFNSILISINPCQYKYYEHLIKQEEKYKQKDWESKCQILKKRYNFFFYTDDYTSNNSNHNKVQDLQRLHNLLHKLYNIIIFHFTKMNNMPQLS